MTNNVEECKITINDETFTKGTYNGISIIIRDKDGFINATDMCNQFNKRFRKLFENHSWQEYFNVFSCEYTRGPNSGGCSDDGEFMYQINKGIPDKLKQLRGTYVDPRLINYIAIWCSPVYAIYVGKIMDSVNDKVHEILHEKQLPDTAENAKPVFVEVAKQIAPSIKSVAEQQCWGVRDDVHSLDSWERDDLCRYIDDYKKIKERLNEVERKINVYGSFVQRYHPEFKIND
ncbi:hypothetical protein M9Y10_030652 [Tritrichomonas musculus]|uniref:KilA-N domain-containing protein n=1 Tax=Tritrichomonas musculus TaxID=1915356 RepID=A0ABR2H3W2_9EUKA